MNTQKCRRETLVRYLQNRLEEDDTLDFLIHLDSCPTCWEAVYTATKASHPHYYKRALKASRLAEIDLRGVDNAGGAEDEEKEEVFEVA